MLFPRNGKTELQRGSGDLVCARWHCAAVQPKGIAPSVSRFGQTLSIALDVRRTLDCLACRFSVVVVVMVLVGSIWCVARRGQAFQACSAGWGDAGRMGLMEVYELGCARPVGTGEAHRERPCFGAFLESSFRAESPISAMFEPCAPRSDLSGGSQGVRFWESPARGSCYCGLRA
jgi:hypothetical protein